MIYIFYFYFLYFFYIFFIYPLYYILFIYIYFIYFIIHNFYFYFYIILFFYSLRAFYGNNSSTAHLTKPTVHKSDLTVKHNECTSPFISLNTSDGLTGLPALTTQGMRTLPESVYSIALYDTIQVQEESQLEEEGGSEPYRASTVFGLSPAWSSTSAPNNWPDTEG